MDVLDWIEKARKFSEKKLLEGFSELIIADENAVDVQREQWETAGTSYKDVVIGIYKKSSEELSGGSKIAGTPWNLRNTGNFWENLFLMAVAKGNDIEFTYNSSGINKSALFETIQKHGEITNPEDIFGLTEYYKKPFIAIIEPKFVQQLETYYHV